MCFWLGGTRKGAGRGLRLFEFEFKGEGGRGWGGCLFEVGANSGLDAYSNKCLILNTGKRQIFVICKR